MTTTALSAEAAAPADGRGWGVPGVGVVADAGGGRGSSGGTGGPPPTGHPVCAAVLSCLEELDGVREAGVATLRPQEIRLMLLAVVQLIATLFALKMRLLVVGQAQRIEDLTGATSTVAFLSHLTQTRRAAASQEMRLARDLDRRYPLLADALARGLMGPEHVAVAVAALRRLPRDLDPEKLAACQQALVDAAQVMDPGQLRAVGRRLWEVIDPDGAEAKEGKALEDEEELARARAFFRSWRNGDGTTGFRGKLPDAQADMLIKALQAFAAPRRRPDTPQDEETPSDDVADSAAPDGLHDDESPEERETGRPVPYPVKLGQALMDLLERLPEDLLPDAGGVSATVTITMTLEQLREGLGAAALDTGTAISASQARRLACEAAIVPVVLDGRGVPLDVGRAKRLFTHYQRKALAVRDKGCVIDGCDRPAAWCHAHHWRSWKDGGPTDLSNGGLVCAYHHGLLHSPKWETVWARGKPRLRRVFA